MEDPLQDEISPSKDVLSPNIQSSKVHSSDPTTDSFGGSPDSSEGRLNEPTGASWTEEGLYSVKQEDTQGVDADIEGYNSEPSESLESDPPLSDPPLGTYPLLNACPHVNSHYPPIDPSSPVNSSYPPIGSSAPIDSFLPRESAPLSSPQSPGDDYLKFSPLVVERALTPASEDSHTTSTLSVPAKRRRNSRRPSKLENTRKKQIAAASVGLTESGEIVFRSKIPYYHEKNKEWRAKWTENGVPRQKTFSTKRFGSEAAKGVCDWIKHYIDVYQGVPTELEIRTFLSNFIRNDTVEAEELQLRVEDGWNRRGGNFWRGPPSPSSKHAALITTCTATKAGVSSLPTESNTYGVCAATKPPKRKRSKPNPASWPDEESGSSIGGLKITIKSSSSSSSRIPHSLHSEGMKGGILGGKGDFSSPPLGSGGKGSGGFFSAEDALVDRLKTAEFGGEDSLFHGKEEFYEEGSRFSRFRGFEEALPIDSYVKLENTGGSAASEAYGDLQKGGVGEFNSSESEGGSESLALGDGKETEAVPPPASLNSEGEPMKPRPGRTKPRRVFDSTTMKAGSLEGGSPLPQATGRQPSILAPHECPRGAPPSITEPSDLGGGGGLKPSGGEDANSFESSSNSLDKVQATVGGNNASYHPEKMEWRARFYVNGRRKMRTYSAKFYGYDIAQQMAEEFLEFIACTGRLPSKVATSEEKGRKKKVSRAVQEIGSLADSGGRLTNSLGEEEWECASEGEVLLDFCTSTLAVHHEDEEGVKTSSTASSGDTSTTHTPLDISSISPARLLDLCIRKLVKKRAKMQLSGGLAKQFTEWEGFGSSEGCASGGELGCEKLEGELVSSRGVLEATPMVTNDKTKVQLFEAVDFCRSLLISVASYSALLNAARPIFKALVSNREDESLDYVSHTQDVSVGDWKPPGELCADYLKPIEDSGVSSNDLLQEDAIWMVVNMLGAAPHQLKSSTSSQPVKGNSMVVHSDLPSIEDNSHPSQCSNDAYTTPPGSGEDASSGTSVKLTTPPENSIPGEDELPHTHLRFFRTFNHILLRANAGLSLQLTEFIALQKTLDNGIADFPEGGG